jgi:hypothetical protein
VIPHTSGVDQPAFDELPWHQGRDDETPGPRIRALYLIIDALVVIAIFGYQLYRERHNMTGMGINAGGRDISIQKK